MSLWGGMVRQRTMHDLSNKRERTIQRSIERGAQLLLLGAHASTQYTRWRLAIFLAGFFTCLFLYKSAMFHAGNLALGLFLVMFLTVSYFHSSLKKRVHRLGLWQQIKNTNLARLRLDWENIPAYPVPPPTDHPYANDLDLTGPHSLLNLINSTVSTAGRDRLASWLLDQNQHLVPISNWTTRQGLIQEVTSLSLLRDRITLEANLISENPLDSERIQKLLDHPIEIPHLKVRLILSVLLCLCTISLGLLSATIGLPGYWIVSFGLYTALFFFTAPYVAPVFGRVLDLQDELTKLVAIVKKLEGRTYSHHPHLLQLCQALINDETRPTVEIKRLGSICHGLSVKAHPLVHIIMNALMPWDLSFAYRLNQASERLQMEFPTWLDQLATLDAANSLGTFAYLNPHYVWPILETRFSDWAQPGFTTRQIGHPLIPEERRVRNSLGFRELGQVLLVTGSNMSGKSTFLRTLGINVCLAQAGGPVCAETFSWSWLRLYCCIRVTDSLAEGLSYFYAEVKRLKVVLEAVTESQGHPVLFLIDEIYKGTNNRERLGGSQAFIEALQTGNGLGLLSTHDLELAQLEHNGSRVSNVHFQETVEDGKLHFDYLLRSGPCPTTNALRIMEQEGLPIPENKEEEEENLK